MPFPFPWDLLDPGIERTFPALAGEFFTTEPSGKPYTCTVSGNSELNLNSDALFGYWSAGTGASLMAQWVKNLPAVQEMRVQSLGGEDPLEKEMATHSSILAWKIPWTEETRRLQSIGLQRVRHD